MDIFIVNIVNIEFFTTCSYVCIFIKITFKKSIDRGKYPITPKIELTRMNKQRIIYISLYNESWILAISTIFSIRNKSFYMRKFTANLYSITSISIFTRLYNPNVAYLRVL